ncbi:MAG: CHASE2 domain-containing protein [Prochlorotrichaceae cyanobacterium]
MKSLWKKVQSLGQRHSVVQSLIIIPIVAGTMIAGSEVGVFRVLEWSLTDQFYSLSLPRKSSDTLQRFALVTIDESDITAVQKWPMTDEVMLRLFENIFRQQPRVVGMDIYRDLPVEPGHAQLQQFFATTPNLFGIEQVKEPTIAPPPVLAAKGQVSASDSLIDRDGVIRRGLVQLRDEEGRAVEGFGAYAALRYLEGEDIHLDLIDRARNSYRLGEVRFFPLTGKNVLYTPEEIDNTQILIHYSAHLEQFPNISLWDVINNKIPDHFFTDRIVLVGSKAPSLNDNYRTPFNNGFGQKAQLMPGVVIYANMAAHLIDTALNDRPFLQRPVASLDYSWLIFWTSYGTFAGVLYVRYRWSTLSLLILGIAIAVGTAYLLFLQGWVILLFTPILALIISTLASALASLWYRLNQSYQTLAQQRDLLQQANETLKHLNDKYSRFVPFDYIRFLGKESILDLELGDHTSRKMAIMFSDIRNFTSISESMTPQKTFDFVNGYLQKVSPEIRNYDGIVVKFMGDSILSIFPSNTDNCLKAAIAKQRKLAEYNVELKAQGLRPIEIGIGIHVGNLMLGIIGEESRMQGDVLSDAVNLASRLESLTKRYGASIIISGDTLLDLEYPDQYRTRLLDQVIVKGRSQPISIFEVLDGEPKKSFQLKTVCQTTFERGLVYYFNQDFSQAHDHFSRVLSINPTDLTTRLYLDRISYFRTYGVPENWQGVWHFQDK